MLQTRDYVLTVGLCRSVDDMRKNFDVNVFGAFDVTQKLAPIVLKSKQKLLMLMSSELGYLKYMNSMKPEDPKFGFFFNNSIVCRQLCNFATNMLL